MTAPVGYVLKGYPRLSELFIASEIWRLEQIGLPLRIFVVKPADESVAHPVVSRIAAVPEYLPATSSLTAQPTHAWLAANLPTFAPALRRVARRHPVRLARVVGSVVAEAVRGRTGRRLRRVYLKEGLLAVDLADRIERTGGVAHLHAHFAHGATTTTMWAARLLGVPFSFTGHAKDIYRESLNPAGLLRRKLAAAAFAVTCTGANAEHLRALAPPGRVHRVYHGLNADLAWLLAEAPPRDAWRAGEPFRVVSVGRAVPKKGFDVLLRAIALLRDAGLAVEVVLAGERGPESARLEALVGELGLCGVVEMRGPLGQRDLLAEYRRSSVFALACRIDADGDRDGIPNVLVEAMAAGLPVASTAVSGIPELITDGVDGLLVPAEDPAALAAALARLVADPDLRDRLAAGGQRRVVRDFDGDVLAARLAGLLAPHLPDGQPNRVEPPLAGRVGAT